MDSGSEANIGLSRLFAKQLRVKPVQVQFLSFPLKLNHKGDIITPVRLVWRVSPDKTNVFSSNLKGVTLNCVLGEIGITLACHVSVRGSSPLDRTGKEKRLGMLEKIKTVILLSITIWSWYLIVLTGQQLVGR